LGREAPSIRFITSKDGTVFPFEATAAASPLWCLITIAYAAAENSKFMHPVPGGLEVCLESMNQTATGRRGACREKGEIMMRCNLKNL
jgi:hypothetical protein